MHLTVFYFHLVLPITMSKKLAVIFVSPVACFQTVVIACVYCSPANYNTTDKGPIKITQRVDTVVTIFPTQISF